MAVHLNGTDGNNCVVLAGHWNASDSGLWYPPWLNGTSLSFVFTIQPDALTAGRLTQQVVDYGTFSCYHEGNGILTAFLMNVDGNIRRLTTGANESTAPP